ncbi:hypothetical protein BV22DRAFT_792190 [Leucogyrophana mollusca]|uniref:Uncharacterized protein n=1 Tax=Leucogyrophana mollusca TaxID=85980 RepID=A0ACB8B493_9AGAM|nr:hypothetical protein BV22DRAFT_792190 [Leucogyrophana mollusca]
MESPFTELSDSQSICYATMATGAAIMYDQILYFSQEVDFIWVGLKMGVRSSTLTWRRQNRRWTIMTALYFVVRVSNFLLALCLTVWLTLYNHIAGSLLWSCISAVSRQVQYQAS